MRKYASLFTIILLVLFVGCAPRQICDAQAWSDLTRSTVWGYNPRYTLRYDPFEWVCIENPNWGDKSFYSKSRDLEITVWSHPDDKNLSPDFLENRFQEVAASHLDNFEEIQFLPSDVVSVNDVTFLYHCALGASGENRRHIFQYTYSNDNGCVSMFCTAKRGLTEADHELISEFLRGYSTDGQGCKGVAPLRTMKNVLDIMGVSPKNY